MRRKKNRKYKDSVFADIFQTSKYAEAHIGVRYFEIIMKYLTHQMGFYLIVS